MRAAVIAVVLATATVAAADERAVVVVNATSGDARAAAAERVAALRAYLVDRGLARRLPDALADAVEGAGDDAYAYDGSGVERAYAAFDYAGAHELLATATADALAAADSGALAAILAEIWLWRGMIAVAEGDASAADRWFRAALRLRPDRVLDPAVVPPRVRAAYARARGPETRARGVLRLRVAPADAVVSVDDRRRASPAKPLSVAAGPHVVVVEQPGFARDARVVFVRPGDTLDLELQLAPETRAMAARRATAELAGARGPPPQRLLAALAELVGARWLLVVTDDRGGVLVARLYDARTGARSRAMTVPDDEPPRAIARMVAADSVDLRLPARADAPARTDLGGAPATARRDAAATPAWYERWWVWATVGAVAVSATSAYVLTRDDDPQLVGFGRP